MNFEIVNEFPHELLLSDVTPCISIYQPNNRHRPENQQNPIRFKNLLQQVETTLLKDYPRKEVDELLQPLERLQMDRPFWDNAGDGMALFATKDRCIIYRLQREVNELAVVSDSFHIKPLIRVFQSADRFHLLGLNRNHFVLYEGNRYGIEQVELPDDLATTRAEALGEQVTESYVSAGVSGSGGTAMFHGYGAKKDEIDIDIERFFRHVDRTVMEHYSKPMKLPLYLVALPEYHTIFYELSHNSCLRKNGIKIDFESLNLEQLREVAWKHLEPIYLEKTEVLVDTFQNARAKDLGSDDIVQVVKAASENRVGRLLLESDRLYPGKIDLTSGEIQTVNVDQTTVDDVLDDLAEIVYRNKGEVVVLPKERMPSETGVAAIYRY